MIPKISPFLMSKDMSSTIFFPLLVLKRHFFSFIVFYRLAQLITESLELSRRPEDRSSKKLGLFTLLFTLS